MPIMYLQYLDVSDGFDMSHRESSSSHHHHHHRSSQHQYSKTYHDYQQQQSEPTVGHPSSSKQTPTPPPPKPKPKLPTTTGEQSTKLSNPEQTHNSTKQNLEPQMSVKKNSTTDSEQPIIEPLQAPVYGGQSITVTLPLELAEQANLDGYVINQIVEEQEHSNNSNNNNNHGGGGSDTITNTEHVANNHNFPISATSLSPASPNHSSSSVPSLYLLITGSTQRHLCELIISKHTSSHVILTTTAPEHEPPEKTKVSLIVWRNHSSEDEHAAEPNPENLSSAMTLTSKFTYVIDQTCYLSVYLAQSVYDYDALEDWDSIEGPQFSLAREDFTTLDQRLCAAFDHLFLPDNWSLLGNADEDILLDPGKAADQGLLEPRETLLHFAARLGLEKTIKLLMTKPGASYCSQVRNRHQELASDIARKNSSQMRDLLPNDGSKHKRQKSNSSNGGGGGGTKESSRKDVTKSTIEAFDNIEQALDSMTTNEEPWLQAHVVNDRSVIKQNIDVDTWTLSSTADDEGKFQPISEDLRLLSGFGILHSKLKIENDIPNSKKAHTRSTSDIIRDLNKHNQHDSHTYTPPPTQSPLAHSPKKFGRSVRHRPTKDQPSSSSTTKQSLVRHNSDVAHHTHRESSKRTPPTTSKNRDKDHHHPSSSSKQPTRESRRRNKDAPNDSRPKRPQSWHSSNSSIDNNLAERPKIKKSEKKSISDGSEHKSKRLQHSVKNKRTPSDRDKTTDHENNHHPPPVQSKTMAETMSWSEFLAESSQVNAASAASAMNTAGGSGKKGHNVVSSNSQGQLTSSRSRQVGRKHSILDRLRMKGKSTISRKASDKAPSQVSTEETMVAGGGGDDEHLDQDNPSLENQESCSTSTTQQKGGQTTNNSTSQTVIDGKDRDNMMVTAHDTYVITRDTHHDNIAAEKSGKLPSRASSGASSSGYLFRPQPRNQEHRDVHDRGRGGTGGGLGGQTLELSSDEGTGEEINENRQDSVWEELLMHESLTEGELWQLQTKDHPKLSKTITDVEVKRQETIYEFIKTERSHLKTLQLMKNVWAKGLSQKPFRHIKVSKLLPGIEGMIYQSRKFLLALHERQAEQYPQMESIGDVVAKYWLDEEDHIVQVFGYFCSFHADALAYYKELFSEDKKFAQFIQNTRASGNTRRLDLPDCMQLAMQRITKYQIMVTKIKERTGKIREREHQNLKTAIDQILKIAEKVDQQVKFVNREKRLEDICKRLESKGKALTVGRKTSFSKDDMKYDKRRLLFESRASIKATQNTKQNKKTKDPIEVLLLLMTDYLVMLKTKKELMADNHSYVFVNLSGQPTVLPLRGLIIRENPTNANERYILSAKHVEIGLYELAFREGESATVFTEQIRLAAANCPDIPLDEGVDSDEELTRQRLEEKRKTEERFTKCNQLLTKIRKHETKILTLTNEKIDMSNELRAITTLTEPSLMKTLTQLESTQIEHNGNASVVIQEAQRLTKELKRSDLQEKLAGTLRQAFQTSCQQETTIAALQTDIAKMGGADRFNVRESKDLNQMERIHDIESKRFDRQRRKEKEDLKKFQNELERQKDELEDMRKAMERERLTIEREKEQLDKEKTARLKNLQDENDGLQVLVLDKDRELQRTLLQIRDMQRQLDDLGHGGKGIADNSPKSSQSASPGSSFGKADSNSSTQRSNSDSKQPPDLISSSGLRRGDSLSPDRNNKLRISKKLTDHDSLLSAASSGHQRSKSSVSSKLNGGQGSGGGTTGTQEQMLLPLQLSSASASTISDKHRGGSERHHNRSHHHHHHHHHHSSTKNNNNSDNNNSSWLGLSRSRTSVNDETLLSHNKRGLSFTTSAHPTPSSSSTTTANNNNEPKPDQQPSSNNHSSSDQTASQKKSNSFNGSSSTSNNKSSATSSSSNQTPTAGGSNSAENVNSTNVYFC